MKYVLAVLGLACVLMGLGLWAEHERANVATAKAASAQEHAKAAEMALTKANDQIALQRTTSLARQQELNRLRVQAAAQQKALNEALQASPDWAHAPVPDGVWDALRAPGVSPAGKAGPGVAGTHPDPAAVGPRQRRPGILRQSPG